MLRFDPVHDICSQAQIAAEVAQGRLLDATDENRPTREVEFAMAKAAADVALQMLRAGDEPRYWGLTDEDEDEFPTTVVARPSEVRALLEEEVRSNCADVVERQVKGYAHCKLTGETIEVVVTVPALPQD